MHTPVSSIYIWSENFSYLALSKKWSQIWRKLKELLDISVTTQQCYIAYATALTYRYGLICHILDSDCETHRRLIFYLTSTFPLCYLLKLAPDELFSLSSLPPQWFSGIWPTLATFISTIKFYSGAIFNDMVRNMGTQNFCYCALFCWLSTLTLKIVDVAMKIFPTYSFMYRPRTFVSLKRKAQGSIGDCLFNFSFCENWSLKTDHWIENCIKHFMWKIRLDVWARRWLGSC
jgi:hypothetical protein